MRIGISEEVQVQSVTESLNPKKLNAQGKNMSSSGILFESPIALKIGSQVARVEIFDLHFDIGVAFLDMNAAGESEFFKTLLQALVIS